MPFPKKPNFEDFSNWLEFEGHKTSPAAADLNKVLSTFFNYWAEAANCDHQFDANGRCPKCRFCKQFEYYVYDHR